MFDSEQTPWRRRIIIFSGIQAFLGVPPPQAECLQHQARRR